MTQTYTPKLGYEKFFDLLVLNNFRCDTQRKYNLRFEYHRAFNLFFCFDLTVVAFDAV